MHVLCTAHSFFLVNSVRQVRVAIALCGHSRAHTDRHTHTLVVSKADEREKLALKRQVRVSIRRFICAFASELIT